MFCRNCGTQLADDARFCGNCGTRVRDMSDSIPEVPSGDMPVQTLPEPSAPEPPDGKRKHNKAVTAIAIALTTITALTAAFIAMGGMDKLKIIRQLDLGNRYLNDMEYEEAIIAFEAAIAIDPKEEEAYIGLADAYMGLSDYESAIRILGEGIVETDSDMLRNYLETVQERWDDAERRVYGCVYAVDTDLDDTNNTGIPNAYIYVTDTAGNTVTCRTDSEGHYDSEHLSKGTYTVRFTADGYVEYEREVELTGGKYEIDACIEPDTYATLYGSVLIADEDTDYSNNYPLDGAEISLKKLTGSSEFSVTGLTDGNGQYMIPDLLMGMYQLTVSKSGYLTIEQTLVIYEGQSISYNTLIEAIGMDRRGAGTASGTIYDALTGNGVTGLTLRLREGLNNTDGEVLGTIKTDSSGHYQTPGLESGNYCIEISDERPGEKERYLGSAINIKVLGGLHIDNQDGTVSNTIQTGQLRIVLTWGATPDDLDSHLICNMHSGEQYHIFFNDRTFYSGDERIADLDLDDVDCYGPETTTIYQDDPGEYLFLVHNYSGNNEYELAGSGACVQVYMGYSTVPMYVFYVPNDVGYGWEVFRYDSVTGLLTPSNRMYREW